MDDFDNNDSATAIETRLDFWPLVISIVRGPSTLSEHVTYLDEWQPWFSRSERFAVLRIFENESALVEAEGASAATKKWMRDGAADGIRQRVTNVVNVVPASVYPRMAGTNVEKAFGIPGLITADLPEALRWLQESTRGRVDWPRVAESLGAARPDAG